MFGQDRSEPNVLTKVKFHNLVLCVYITWSVPTEASLHGQNDPNIVETPIGVSKKTFSVCISLPGTSDCASFSVKLLCETLMAWTSSLTNLLTLIATSLSCLS